ncbi:flagellar basal body rod C-terminal domain-containing protein [Desulfobaculum senezii]|jgi:flagellar basal-body rod protein FlgC|uniref:flagellar basal body rod C-terminal domain-containing protein n=1 Tax=Desulfobaculum sp. SPO524 TaxID=3378071 RepID=UPI0038544282
MKVLGTAQSALSAFSTAQAVTANNIANVNTEEFMPSRTDFEERPDYSGVAVADISQEGSAVPTAGGVLPSPAPSQTDLAVEMTTLMSNQRAFEASAAVVRTQDEMLGTLLDNQV